MIQPLADQILVELLPEDRRIGSGLLLAPDQVSDPRGGEYNSPLRDGIVRAVGPGKRDKRGVRRPCVCQVGQRVTYPHHRSVPVIDVEGRPHVIIHEAGVLWMHTEGQEAAHGANV